jgi:hypothetical protein
LVKTRQPKGEKADFFGFESQKIPRISKNPKKSQKIPKNPQNPRKSETPLFPPWVERIVRHEESEYEVGFN